MSFTRSAQWVENPGDGICERSGRLCLLVDEMISFEDADIRVEDFSGITLLCTSHR